MSVRAAPTPSAIRRISDQSNRSGARSWAHFLEIAAPSPLASQTSHAAAGQLQQRPTAREGGWFKREWFTNPVKFVPEGLQLSAGITLGGIVVGLYRPLV
jgi:hypothetical protein